MTYQIKNMLVTGSAGFIGSNFVQYMLEHYPPIHIISLDKLTYAGNLSNLSSVKHAPNHVLVEGDINDSPLVLSLLRTHHIDTIVHFAAESHVDNSISNPKIFLETNIIGTYSLLEAARTYWLTEQQWDKRSCRFHHVSTDEVYGSLEPDAPAFTEHHQYQPNSPYSASKASSDHLVRAYVQTFGLPATTSNCSNNFGPHQHAEKLIPKVIRACLEQQPITIYGSGRQIRDWLYVTDHCEAINLIIEKGVVGEIYNVGGDNEYENIVLIKLLCALMDKIAPQSTPYESLIVFVEDRKGHDQRYAIDTHKIKQHLGFKPQSDFQSQLEATARFYLSQWG